MDAGPSQQNPLQLILSGNLFRKKTNGFFVCRRIPNSVRRSAIIAELKYDSKDLLILDEDNNQIGIIPFLGASMSEGYEESIYDLYSTDDSGNRLKKLAEFDRCCDDYEIYSVDEKGKRIQSLGKLEYMGEDFHIDNPNRNLNNEKVQQIPNGALML